MSTIWLETHDGSSRFYQVEVKGLKTVVKFGKIGTDGQTHEQEHATTEAAAEYAEHLVTKQLYKGFERETKRKIEVVEEGPRKSAKVALDKMVKDNIAEKAAAKKASKKSKKSSKKGSKKSYKEEYSESDSDPPPPPKKKKPAAKKDTKKGSKSTGNSANLTSTRTNPKTQAPIEWEVKLPANGLGIYVNETHVYAGDENGLVQQFDKEGNVQKQYRLPAGVKCIVGDGEFLYVGTNDGALYDITTGVPRLTSKVEEFSDVCWMDIKNGLIVASDISGKVALINAEGETIWSHKEEPAKEGCMCLLDDTGVYHSNQKGVHKRDLTQGNILWDTADLESVLFGQQDATHVYCVNNQHAYKIDKATGKVDVTYAGGGPSVAVAKDSKTVTVANCLTIFNVDGELRNKFDEFKYGAMPAALATWGEHELYGINTCLVKYGISPELIEQAKEEKLETKVISMQSLTEVVPETSVGSTADTTSGVVCECVKKNGKLRVHVTSDGYDNSWNVQFPRAIREDGAKYVVERVVDQGGFYRAWGDIRKVKS